MKKLFKNKIICFDIDGIICNTKKIIIKNQFKKKKYIIYKQAL